MLAGRGAAGRVRADEKRRLSVAKDQLVSPYENVRYMVDDLVAQIDIAKSKLEMWIAEQKVTAT
jgi:hypothetical protein